MDVISSDSEENITDTPSEIFEAPEEWKLELLPTKSRKLYENTYDEFVTFLELHHSKSCKPSSLWLYYSMLKATINLHNNIDISKYSRLIAFLKRKNDGYKPKKSKILSRDEIDVFLNNAPDDIYLMMKVSLIFGICGACRREELSNITIDDIQDLGKALLVTIRESKTKIQRVFSIIDNENKSSNFLEIYRKYASLRPQGTDHRRFFVYYKNNKCSRQVVGKNMFGQIPFKIATYLKLPNAREYTGHCFRRSSATLLADAPENITNIKRHAGWKSTAVAESYIEGSVANKLKIDKKIAGNDMPLNIPLNAPSTSCDNIEKDLRQPFDIVTNNKPTAVEQVTISNYVRQDKHHEYVMYILRLI
ncbi:hypothetical protein NQ317_005464 [Molorchus minor]|uniref:Tyr recombinase domain-containing protein n=1 Tax=Molorchus minor TaxID=1323400 RepID=A0ABQ9JE79_9CUCU|nr:hypothetical protein NQ317_005464 [Molorchus minor]